MNRRFWSRTEAGMLLGRALSRFKGTPRLAVLALPRGGVPVAYEVARALEAPLDILVVRKLGLPGCPERAMGAIAAGGIRVLDTDLIREFRVHPGLLERVVSAEQAELTRREHSYRGWSPAVDLKRRPVLLVDDGLATGATMRAAVSAARQRGAASVAVAVPVCALDTCRRLTRVADEVVCLRTPEPFKAVGMAYDQFPQLDDHDVRDLLERAHRADAAGWNPEPAHATA
jgi:putative phosphoribosyl transferase